jgi:hypothetical protein
MINRSAQRKSEFWPGSAALQLACLLVAVLLMIGYQFLRYDGYWAVGGDASLFTRATHTILSSNTIVPNDFLYANGYGYQSVLIYLHRITGISLANLQTYVLVILLLWLVVPTWLLYREWLSTPHAATLATLLLFIQPEFLFVTMRSTHEKFTRGLIMLALFLLLRSIQPAHLVSRFAAYLLVFYFFIFGIMTFNFFFATSLLFAILLALGFTYLGTIYLQLPQPGLGSKISIRLKYILVVAVPLTFLFIFYIYQPAARNLEVLGSLADKIASLFLEVDSSGETVTNPYQRWVIGAWIDLKVYFLMALATWLLLIGSALIWSWRTLRWLLFREPFRDQKELLLWSFYGAFALIGFVSVIADLTGSLQSNLQHRAFPSFATLAAPLTVAWFLRRYQDAGRRVRIVLRAGVGVGLALLALLSLLKATNEPLLSNRWMFFHPAEVRAVNWASDNLSGRELWTDFDPRIREAVHNYVGGESPKVSLDINVINPGTRDVLVSEITRLRSQRLSLPLPVHGDDLITYDNGQSQIYHQRPQTPFQR